MIVIGSCATLVQTASVDNCIKPLPCCVSGEHSASKPGLHLYMNSPIRGCCGFESLQGSTSCKYAVTQNSWIHSRESIFDPRWRRFKPSNFFRLFSVHKKEQRCRCFLLASMQHSNYQEQRIYSTCTSQNYSCWHYVFVRIVSLQEPHVRIHHWLVDAHYRREHSPASGDCSDL